MPIWLRKFTYKKIGEHYSKNNKKEDSFIESTKKFKDMKKINPAQMKQFQFKKKPNVRYSKK